MAALVGAHATSRLITSTVVQSSSYVQDSDTSKSSTITTHRLTPGEMAFSATFAALPLALFHPHWVLALAVVPAYLARVLLVRYFERRIGGYTGDCLGAVQQVTELVFYLGVLALWTST